jgi:DNA-directed RNA polymerase subunit RPC12/RpoP
MRGGLITPHTNRLLSHGRIPHVTTDLRAMARAGLVQGWRCECRACGKVLEPPERRALPCPGCGMRLLPRPVHLPFTFRHLRSTAATNIDSLRIATDLLGHSSESMTARAYRAPASQTAMREALEERVRRLGLKS